MNGRLIWPLENWAVNHTSWVTHIFLLWAGLGDGYEAVTFLQTMILLILSFLGWEQHLVFMYVVVLS